MRKSILLIICCVVIFLFLSLSVKSGLDDVEKLDPIYTSYPINFKVHIIPACYLNITDTKINCAWNKTNFYDNGSYIGTKKISYLNYSGRSGYFNYITSEEDKYSVVTLSNYWVLPNLTWVWMRNVSFSVNDQYFTDKTEYNSFRIQMANSINYLQQQINDLRTLVCSLGICEESNPQPSKNRPNMNIPEE